MDRDDFIARVGAALDEASSLTGTHATVSSGIFNLHAGFADPVLANEYLRSFLPRRVAQGEVSLSVLTCAEIDLSSLVPKPAEQGRVYIGDTHGLIWAPGADPVLYIFDRVAQRGLVWLASNAAPAWELSRPACPLINFAALEGPWTVAHGAGVGRAGQLLMLAGKGRSGKTTAALACARAGWDYAGDDYLFADSATGHVEPLYCSARLRADMAGSFRQLVQESSRAISSDFGETKHELDLARVLQPARIRGGRIAAILLPHRRGAARVEFTPARHADAFHALFTTTSLSAPGPMKSYAAKLSALAARAPVYFVDTGPDPAAIPDAFERFLESAELPSSARRPAFPG